MILMKNKKYITDFLIVDKHIYNNQHYSLRLQHPDKLPPVLPGQFVELLVDNSPTTFLRRPFSIHDADYKENTISLFIKVMGTGSAMLKNKKEGECLNMVYPLGNSFTVKGIKKSLLIGGGCGIAPLLYLAKSLAEEKSTVHCILGGKTKEDIHEIEKYQCFGNVDITTEDGSIGHKGLVTNHPVINTIAPDMVYACGPEPMLKAVHRWAKEKNIACEVSLENTMACGIGACLCCVTPTVEGNRCVCTEGPVFNTKKLLWGTSKI